MLHKPRWVAILGIGAYRVAFDRPRAVLGLQIERIGGAGVWVLPNPSGLNAAHQPVDLAACAFQKLRNAAFLLLFTVLARSASAQALPADLPVLLENARLHGPPVAWCRAEFQSGKSGAYAVASGGRYIALDPAGHAAELASYKGTPLISPVTVARRPRRSTSRSGNRKPSRTSYATLEHHGRVRIPRGHRSRMLATRPKGWQVHKGWRVDNLTRPRDFETSRLRDFETMRR